MKKIIQVMKKFKDIKPSENPEAIIIIGPPGSGKALLAEKLKERFVILDIDELRCEPETVMDEFDEAIYRYKTQADAEKRREDLMERFILERKNVLIQGRSGAKRWYETALNIHYSGYKVNFIFIGVSKDICKINLQRKLENDRNEKGYGIIIEDDFLDYSFKSIPELLITILKDKLKVVNSCIIVDRNGNEKKLKTKEEKYKFINAEYKK